MAQLSAREPEIIAPKGLGPGFWWVTLALTAVNVVLAFYIIFANLDWVLPQASDPAADSAVYIDGLLKFMSAVGGAIVIYVAGYTLYFAIAFRRRPGEAADTIGVQIHDSTKLETWWTVIPLLLLVVLIGLSVVVWYELQFPRNAPALTVQVVGHQFNFEYRYPGMAASIYSPELMHLPAGKQVRILLTSADVLHSFWVPEFRTKQAMVPGLVQEINVTTKRPGTFDIVCAEFCGVNHSDMQGRLVVEPPEAFERWLASAKLRPANSTAAISLAGGEAGAGKLLFAQKCAACHSAGPFEQRIVGPGLGKLTNDPKHPRLVNAKDPTPQNIAGILEEGYNGPAGVMPNRQATGLSGADIANLVAYLVSLK